MSAAAPSDYVPRFTEAEIEERFVWLGSRALLYVEGLTKRHPTWNLGVDLLVMKNVALSMMDDIWRYKVYHLASPEKKSDAVKRSAYLTKWITKLRPIYSIRPFRMADFAGSFDKEDQTLFVNEGFAIFLSCQTLATDLKKEVIGLSPDFLFKLNYDLHFRGVTDDFLLSIYQTVLDIAGGKHIMVS